MSAVRASIERVERVAKRFEETVFYAVQYRACEAGRNRPDPIDLLHSLTEETGKTRGEVRSGIIRLRDDRIIIEQAGEAWRLTESLQDAVAAISSVDGESTIDLLLDRPGARIEHLRSGSEGRSVGASIFRAVWHEAMYVRSTARVRVLFVHDLDWITASTELFWRSAIEAEKENAAFIVCARKVSPQAFGLCKRIGARALQYYMPISDERGRGAARELEQSVGWFGATLFDGLTSHPIAERLEQLLNEPVALDAETILRVSHHAKTPPAARLRDWAGGASAVRSILRDTRQEKRQNAETSVKRPTQEATSGSQQESIFGRRGEKTRLGVKAW